MKKLYNAPEVEMLRFAPVEQIADQSNVEANMPALQPEKIISDPNNAIFIPGGMLGF